MSFPLYAPYDLLEGDLMYNIYQIFIMTALISFMGFCLEEVWLCATKGYIDNRNMNTPFLLGYGLAVVGMYYVIGTPHDMRFLCIFPVEGSRGYLLICYAVTTGLLVSLGEMLLGTLTEKISGVVWWNYTWIPLHVTKYTSVPTSIGFALIITLFMDQCFDPVMEVISRIAPDTARNAGIILISLITLDFVVCMNKIRKTGHLNITWRYEPHVLKGYIKK